MARRKKGFTSVLFIDRRSAHGIVVVALFAIALLMLLAVFDFAGKMGVQLNDALTAALGSTRIFLPIFLLVVAIHEAAPERLPLRATNYIGFVLFFVALNPLLQSAAGIAATPEVSGQHGGTLGAMLFDPIASGLGIPGSVVILFALFVVAFLFLTNASIQSVGAVFFKFLDVAKWILMLFVKPFLWMQRKSKERKEAQLRASLVKETADARPQADPASTKVAQFSGQGSAADDEDEEEVDEDEEADEPLPTKPKKHHPHVEVPVELLTRRDQKPTSGDLVHNEQVIQRTLQNFGIPVEMGDVSVGPTVTQFTLKPSEGVKLARITGLHNDLALALAAHPIRIEAPIPGKSLVGIEVPNQSVATVGLREMFESKEWRDRKPGLPFAVGRDVSGKAWVSDLSKMPHVLVAGATGSGKSVCLNTLIMSFLYHHGPDELKMVMIDPKRVELQVYNGIPHLITPVITNTEKTVNALKWGLREMDRRLDVLSKFGARDIGSYNAKAEEKLPYLVFIIDELADLMVTAMQEVEGPIVRLAQMARAVGIHLVLATQRPSVDVLTGLIKANIPARIAFAVASSTDSRTILDQVGAEKLLGRGDMLFQTSDMASPKRVQGAFLSDDEIQRVVEFLKSKYDPVDYDASVVEKAQSNGVAFTGGSLVDDDSDPLIPQAKEEIIRAGKASASLLQRRLKVGYARAARLIDLLEQDGFVGPADGAKPRDILKVEFTNQIGDEVGEDEPDVPEELPGEEKM